MMANILVVGSLNMDLVIESPSAPVMGQTVLGSGFMTSPGGKGANQAVAAARLGGQVNMVGCIGTDIFGKDLLNNLQQNKVGTNAVLQTPNQPTGVAVIIVNQGDNFIVVNSGANFEIQPQTIDSLEPLIAASPIILLQFEIPLDCVKRVMQIAQKYKKRVILNPAPAQPIDDEMWSMMDILIPNELECEQISGLPVKDVPQAITAANVLLTKGCQQVFITLGDRGVVYNNGSQIHHQPAFNVQAVDTTAAGDSFCAAIAVALSEKKSIHEMALFASTVGAVTVTRRGAQTSLPNRQEIDQFLQKIH